MNTPTDNNATVTAEPLEIRTYGDPALRQRAESVHVVTPEIRQLAARMIVTMLHEDARGVGLAAPQVGVALRLITIDTMDGSTTLPANASPGECLLCPRMPLTLVNPELVWFSTERASYNEGCLSIPDVHGDVIRPIRAVLQATTLNGEPINVECSGLLARCLQHEIDHLDGVLFVERMTTEDRARIQPELDRLQRQTLRRLKRRDGLIAKLMRGELRPRAPLQV
ncbi:MAG: peptide deformylase [Lentisphaerae bacterium RIFOXYB12_FULL_65_16]|nr:MAG: peptide deformylase [Lentisphaerae bacterium RIFOXYA12_64_32]OGV86029.1 MAG: peptide deformylase [Lentisphaerae bacterium RIFOXYB12_FULL_65_16]